jgi:hypothetical protein
MKNKQLDKKPKTEKARGKYEEKLVVKGSFLDIMKAAMKEADEKPKKKKKEKDG